MDFVHGGKLPKSNKPSSMPTYLIESNADSAKCPHTVGLLHGNFQLLTELPFLLKSSYQLVQSQEDIHLVHFVSSSEGDELAEFRILNYKNRVIVRATEEDKVVIFGSRASDTPDSKEFYGTGFGGTLVVRGPLTLRHLPQLDHHENVEKKDGCKKGKESLLAGNCLESKVAIVKYSGHVTLNISGYAYLDIADSGQGVSIVLPCESKFSVERSIPHRFQQKTIVQRQKEKFQNTQGMMALETFRHLNI